MASISKPRKRGGKYTIQYFNEHGRRATVKGATDKTVTKQIADKLEADGALRRRGIIDTSAERFAHAEQRPLLEHLGDWKAALHAKGGTTEHPERSYRDAERALALGKIARISQLPPAPVMSAVKELKTAGA